MHTLSTAPELSADLDAIARVLTPDGSRIADHDLDPWLTDLDIPLVQSLYRDMAVTRRADAEGVALQRQGQLGLWAPARGQEAVQIGTARACRSDDFLFPSYRELGVELVRGAQPPDVVLAWRGEEHSTYDPYALNLACTQIIVGAQALHAVGYAMGVQRDGTDQVSVAYFGDGASSQGDVNEALVFASSFRSPVVFVCSNNQWAISEPVGVQARFPIAGRAPGFGIPSLRVDGNDVLACLAAMRWALDHARRGRGPAFLEAITYRMGPHTTSDDPTRYRDAGEVDSWGRRDPLARVEAWLRTNGAFDEEFTGSVQTASDEFAAGMRTAAIGARSRLPIGVFDGVYAEPHTGLEEQRRRFAAYLAGFTDEEMPS